MNVDKNSVITLIQYLATKLSERFADGVICQQYARWLVAALYKKDILLLITETNFVLTPDQQKILEHWIVLLVDKQMPIQYILGTVPFCNLTLAVEPPVLIPRPETEEWVAHLCQQLEPLQNKSLTILDLCTGSGCIALALAQALPYATVYAVDVAPYAIALARKNAERNNCTNIIFVQADLFAAFTQQNIVFDLIVANPPYIALTEWQTLDLSVQQWEDALALTAPDNGLAVITRIIEQAPRYLKKNIFFEQYAVPQLVMEIDRTQANSVMQLMQTAGFMQAWVTQDFSGQDRVVSAHFQ